MTFSTRFSSSFGHLTLEGDDSRVTRLGFGDASAPQGDAVSLSAAAIQLEQYFAGERTEFDVAIELRGTEFERRVWDAVRAIPYGSTATYAEIAARIGRPGACRAVGRANALNPVAIVIPCHRVIGSDGSLTGYAGGIEMKRALLALEAQVVARAETAAA
jgi:methylated-DNA-[protein]-cysteine S-methyltransferase